MFTKRELQQGLKTRVIGRKLFLFDEIDSTNACARVLAEAGTEEGAVIIADFQTAGRGRLGRQWQAERGENLLFSVILRPSISQDQLAFLPFYAAIAVAAGVEHATGCAVECKWPNDLLINAKKFCGILLENGMGIDQIAYSIVGVGINVNQATFPADIQDRATSLTRECGKPVDRLHLMRSVMQQFESAYSLVQEMKFPKLLDGWTRRCRMFGRDVSVQTSDGSVAGIAARLSEDGGLIVRTAEGNRTFYAGDVSILT